MEQIYAKKSRRVTKVLNLTSNSGCSALTSPFSEHLPRQVFEQAQ